MCEVLDQIEARGERRGVERTMQLVRSLIEAGRIDDIRRASVDSNYPADLYEEFGVEYSDEEFDE